MQQAQQNGDVTSLLQIARTILVKAHYAVFESGRRLLALSRFLLERYIYAPSHQPSQRSSKSKQVEEPRKNRILYPKHHNTSPFPAVS
jgi:hypothetical protein